MDYKRMAEQALERRSRLFEKRQGVAADKGLKNDEKRARLSVLDQEMDEAAAEARRYVEEAEHQNEMREAMRNAGVLGEARTPNSAEGEADEWRGNALLPSIEEYRALAEGTPADGGWTVPSGTAARYVDMLRNKAVLLKGLPADNVITFTDKKWTMPVLSDSGMPQLVAENALISEGDDTWAGLEFDAKKYADLRTASNEILADSALNMRQVVGQTMARNLSAQFDADAFNGAGGTSTPLLGLVGQGVSTEVGSAAGDMPTHDDIADAVGRLWAGNAEPTVIWAAPDAATALGKEREGTEGGRLEPNSPLNVARTLPILVSNSVPAGTVVVADGGRVYVGIRQDVRIAVSEHSRFEYDQVQFRLTARAAGIYVVESSSVQVLVKNDGV